RSGRFLRDRFTGPSGRFLRSLLYQTFSGPISAFPRRFRPVPTSETLAEFLGASQFRRIPTPVPENERTEPGFA
ncbi:hypothetical protein, partial [Streptacidiphilus sp. EB129]|uniref:hypothetical protein n=1 Tax=Streptacidiphilus sp. EB129 TaxID=3156262 RepID=UPI003516465C